MIETIDPTRRRTAHLGRKLVTTNWALTPVEVLTLQAMADGLSVQEAARTRWVSPETVRSHRAHVLGKLDALNTANAVAIGLRRGLIR